MAMPMVGRAPALDELRRAWDLVSDRGELITAVLTGAAGTGKSTLVTALLTAARPPVALSGVARVHSPAPYDWLAAVLAGRDTGGLGVPAGALAWLQQDPDVPRERYTPDALLRIAVRVVRTLVGAGPAVLVVEDLQALDPASLNLVAALAAADLPALLLVTSQPPEDPLTARTLARLTGRPGAVRRHLTALPPAGVRAVLRHAYGADAVTADLVDAVWRRTGGNPHRLAELIAVEGADGPAALRGDRTGRTGADDPAAPGGDSAGRTGADDPAAPGGDPTGRTGADDPAAPGGDRTGLTAREREVLGCLAEGRSNKQIAHALGISVRTVAVHVSNLLRKTGASSRTEAALWALRRGPGVAVRTPPG